MIGELICEKYRVEASFSESHLYEIFSATEVATGATVILKILKEEMALNSDRVKVFSDEIKAFAGLSHHMVAEILDVDMFEDRPFVVVPLISGTDLHSIIKERVLSFQDCCRIVQDLATVLQFAADEKVEHRNIKLSNVLIDSDNKLTVLSFTHPRLKLTSRFTRNEKSGVHSDLFFLGTTFFELLAGESSIRKRGGINELWDMKLEKLLRIRHPELTPEQMVRVVDFVRHSLTRDMKQRYSSHEDFLKNLADIAGSFRKNNIRSKVRQLSMASQVVDALNGRMSNVNTAAVSTARLSPRAAEKQASVGLALVNDSGKNSKITGGDNAVESFQNSAFDGNLALALESQSGEEHDLSENPQRPVKNLRPALRLVKPSGKEKNAAAQVWENAEDHHWLRNPVIFMGLCLTVMVFLILFW